MAQINNVMDIFKLLKKNNCRECYAPTCLSFAADVFNGSKQLDECPHIDGEIIKLYNGNTAVKPSMDEDINKRVEELKKKIESIDLSKAAKRIGAVYSDNRLTLRILGKQFHVHSNGKLSSDLHMIPWLTVPVMNYVLEGGGSDTTGKWSPFRELEGGKGNRLYRQTCEKPMKKIADTYTDLFEDLIHIFNGKKVENHYSSDISLVIYPLPKLPILICYWKPEDGLESDLNLFFDSGAESIVNIDIIYSIIAGLVQMFEKISQKHRY